MSQQLFELSPIECTILNGISIFLIIIFLLSLILNLYVLVIFYKNKELHKPINLAIVVLTVANLLGTLLEFPFTILSNFYCRYQM